jgi:probable rRNA maturation factor
MRRLNRRYLGRDYATDVLSFSYEGLIAEGSPFLGEIIIAPEIALQHAVHCGVDPEREFRKLLLHGILHLLGYNHETDRGYMSRVQTGLMRRRFFAASPALADLRARR